MLSIFMVGLVVPSTDDNLLNSSGTAAASPFVIAASRAGIKIVPSIINAVVLTSAWSSGNSGLLNSSRTLYGLAQEGRAFKIFKRTNRLGIPYVAVGFMSLFICLGYMTLVRNSFIFILVDIYILTLPARVSVVTKRFNSLHLAPRSRLSIYSRKLDRHLHRLSPILLRHEKTRHQPRSTSLEKSLPALSRLDYRSIFYSSSLNRRLHHFSPRTVSFSLPPHSTLNISMCGKEERRIPTARKISNRNEFFTYLHILQLEYRNLHILIHQHSHCNTRIFQLQIHLQDTNFVARKSPCASIY